MDKIKIISAVFLSLFFLGISIPSLARSSKAVDGVQQSENTIVCYVSDSQGAVVGANVVVKGSSIGSITDLNGKAVIKGVKSDAVLVISFIGYLPKEVHLKGKREISVKLVEDTNTLDEVVVVGYGSQKKVNLTGAVEHVTSDVFEGRPTANVAQMLMGTVPNLNIELSDGKPNRSASLNVRGTTSIGQGGSALVLIDGVEGSIDMLNPNDIESISVLKDAASASIYGARAPYGVVLITTKSPEKNKMRVSYSANFTLQRPTVVPDIVTDGYTWAEHFYKSYYGYRFSNPSSINKTQQFSLDWLEEYKRRKDSGELGTVVSEGLWGTTKGRYVYFNDETDIYGQLYKKNVFAQTHNISVSGSGEKFDYLLSGRYYYYSGLFDSDTQTDKYTKMNLRSKVGYQLNKWLRISNNTEIAYDDYYNPMTYSEGPGNIWSNLQAEGFPSSPLFNPDGTMTYTAAYSLGDFLYGNSGRDGKNKLVKSTTALTAKFFGDKLRVNADFTISDKDYDQQIKRVKSTFSKSEGIEETIPGVQSYISVTHKNRKYLSTNIFAEYEETIAGKHNLKGMIGYNYEQAQAKQIYAYNEGLLTEDVENINLAMGTDSKAISSTWSKWRTVGAFFRLNYGYDNRYLLEVNGRYDGSSKFPSSQRWAFFPSVSVGWRINEEKWFNVDSNLISNLKLRASYGALGNGNVSTYAYDEKFSIKTTNRIFGGVQFPYTSAPAEIPSSLTWETAETMDFGLDLNMFNNRLALSADYYVRRTKDMYTVGPTLPDVFGASSPKGNYADMTTRGFEISVSWNDRFTLAGKPFKYHIKATLADYQSTIEKFNNSTKALGKINYPTYYEGMKIGEIWGYVCNGLWQTQEEIDIAEAKAKENGQSFYMPGILTSKNQKLHPGDVKFEDLNGNGYIDQGASTVDNPGDRRIIGNKEPRYIYSFNIGAEWNNIFINTFFQGVGKQDWYPSNECGAFWGQYNRPYNQMPKWHLGNYWTEENTSAYLPRYAGYYYPAHKGVYAANSRYLQNVAYLRLKNIQIGYNFPKKLIAPLKLSAASVYLSGENLFTWSPFYKRCKNLDVANIYGSDNDLSDNNIGDGNNYPNMKSFSIGINLTF